MNNISARERETRRERRSWGGEKERIRGDLVGNGGGEGRNASEREREREKARVGTTPWLVGSFDLLPPRNGPLPPPLPPRFGPRDVSFLLIRRPVSSSRSVRSLVFTRFAHLSLFLLSSRDLSPAEKRRPTRQNHTFYDYPLTNNPKLRAVVLF